MPVLPAGSPSAAEANDTVRLGVLREAPEPMTTADVVARLMAARGMEAGDARAKRMAMKRVGMALGRQRENGAVRSTQGPGQFVLWEIADRR